MTINGGFAWLASLSEQMKAEVNNGDPPTPVTLTARSFMAKFGYARRGSWIVDYINRYMRRLDLMTIPDLDAGGIDSTIAVTLRTHTDADTPPDDSTDTPQEPIPIDPTLRISDLQTVINPPVTVNPNAELQQATTIMLRHDFSQLPVMENQRVVQGIISWQSIGMRLALDVTSGGVRDYMDAERINEKVIRSDRPLLEAINLVTEHGYVLVQGGDNTITGIVTATDLSEQFKQLSEPFLLIAEIEGHLRNLIGRNFTASDIESALADQTTSDHISGAEDLSFGHYWYILENRERWAKVGLNVDRVQFIELLKSVNEVRNDVMHFRPKGLTEEDMATLNEAASFLQLLAQIGAI